MAEKKFNPLPGFGLTMGYTLVYLSALVLIPIAGLFLKAFQISWHDFWHLITNPRALAAYKLTFGASFLTAFPLRSARWQVKSVPFIFIPATFLFGRNFFPSLTSNNCKHPKVAAPPASAPVLRVLCALALPLTTWLKVWPSRFNK